ncbi:hypothetical protein LEP1GSC081_4030, partial [Leptospira kirschneri str. H1]
LYQKKGKEAREATIELRFEKLTIKSPQYKKLENIDMYALTATEVDGPEEESILIRTCPSPSFFCKKN